MSATLKAELKTWERAFIDRHGRKPDRSDIKADANIAAKYKEYNKQKQSSSSSAVSSTITASNSTTRNEATHPNLNGKSGGGPRKIRVQVDSDDDDDEKRKQPGTTSTTRAATSNGSNMVDEMVKGLLQTPSRKARRHNNNSQQLEQSNNVSSPTKSIARGYNSQLQSPMKSPAKSMSGSQIPLEPQTPKQKLFQASLSNTTPKSTSSKTKAMENTQDNPFMTLDKDTPRSKARKWMRGEMTSPSKSSSSLSKQVLARAADITTTPPPPTKLEDVNSRIFNEDISKGVKRAVNGIDKTKEIKGKAPEKNIDDEDDGDEEMGPSPVKKARKKFIPLFDGDSPRKQPTSQQQQPLAPKRGLVDSEDDEVMSTITSNPFTTNNNKQQPQKNISSNADIVDEMGKKSKKQKTARGGKGKSSKVNRRMKIDYEDDKDDWGDLEVKSYPKMQFGSKQTVKSPKKIPSYDDEHIQHENYDEFYQSSENELPQVGEGAVEKDVDDDLDETKSANQSQATTTTATSSSTIVSKDLERFLNMSLTSPNRKAAQQREKDILGRLLREPMWVKAQNAKSMEDCAKLFEFEKEAEEEEERENDGVKDWKEEEDWDEDDEGWKGLGDGWMDEVGDVV